jgi:hypothetical protein
LPSPFVFIAVQVHGLKWSVEPSTGDGVISGEELVLVPGSVLAGSETLLSGSLDDFEWFVQENKGILASLDKDGFVEFKINTRGSGHRGTTLFQRMMEHFGDNVRGIWGKWVSGDNLETVNRLTAQGLSLDEAVTRAWTANRARDFGFGRAAIVKAEGEAGAYTNIEVKFTKS